MLDAIDARVDTDDKPARQYFWAIAASVAVAAITAVWILSERIVTTEEATIFETATSQQTANVMDYVLELRFQPNASADDQNRVLTDMGAREILRNDGGSYRVLIRLPARSLQELDEFTSDLRESHHVLSAEVVALQLPVRTDP